MIIKIKPDKKKIESILEMVELIGERIKALDKIKFVTLIISDYYEIIKELMTAVLLNEGYKTLSHKDLINYFKRDYKDLELNEIILIDDLRIVRNRICYEGFKIQNDYLENNELKYLQIIKKLKLLIKNKLK